MSGSQGLAGRAEVLASTAHVDQRALEERRRFARNRSLTIFFFLAPGFILLLVFLLVPIVQAMYYSMFRWNGLGPLVEFQGLENYQQALTNTVFHKALGHTGLLIVLSVLLQLPFSMLMALTLVRGNLRFSSIFRAVFFVPFVFSEIITGLIWVSVFSPRNGLLNWALTPFFPDVANTAWLADKNVVLYAIFLVISWKYFGFHMLLYMAGLQNIDKDVEDAARVSGASEFQVLRFITLPMMGNTIRLSIYLSVLGAMQQFILVWVLTTGGPANASEVIVTFLYKYGIQRMQLGFGAAVAVILLALTLTFSLIYQRYVLREDYNN
jgi:raffinose/stachyose/melibiose transport system permease protein